MDNYQSGYSNFIGNFFEVTLFACIPLFIAHLGAVAVAGHQIAASVTTLLFMMPLSLSIAISIRIGNLFGQKHYEQLKMQLKPVILWRQ